MIIEIKDLPEGQLIEKVDLHIDFIKGVVQTVTTPKTEVQMTQTADTNIGAVRENKEIPAEMTDTEF